MPPSHSLIFFSSIVFLVTTWKARSGSAGAAEGSAAGRPIDKEDFIEYILRHLGPTAIGVRVHSGTDPSDETTLDPWFDDPSPAYGVAPVNICTYLFFNTDQLYVSLTKSRLR